MTTIKTEPQNITSMKSEINKLLSMCLVENINESGDHSIKYDFKEINQIISEEFEG